MKKHYDFIYPGDQGCSDSQTGSLNEEKKKAYFWTLSVEQTCTCSLLLKYHQGKLRKFSKKCVLSFPCLPSVCFCFFPKQLDFQTKRIGTLLWVSWLFSVHVSLAIPLFKQRLLYIVYEVEPRANIITVSCSELTPTKPPSAVLQQDFMSSHSPAPQVWLCPSSAQSSESFDSAGLWAVLLWKCSLPDSDWVAQLKSRCIVWGRCVLRLSMGCRVRRGKATVRAGPWLWTGSSTEFRN